MNNENLDLIGLTVLSCRCCSTLLLFALCNEPEALCRLGPMNIRGCHLTNGFGSQTLKRSHRDAIFSKTCQLQNLSGYLLFYFIERNVFGLCHPQPVQQNRQLTSHGDNRSFFCILSASFIDSLTPLPRSAIRSVVPEPRSERFARGACADTGSRPL